jgi:hypothetical protein
MREGLGDLSSWLVFLHVLGVLGFTLAHGSSVAVAFRLKRERDPQRIRALLDLSGVTIGFVYLALGVILLTGVIVGFTRGWWTSGQLWLWASIVILLGVMVGMYVIASKWTTSVRELLGGVLQREGSLPMPEQPPSDAQIEAVLARGRPGLIAAIGGGGLVVITFLMMFKPF